MSQRLKIVSIFNNSIIIIVYFKISCICVVFRLFRWAPSYFLIRLAYLAFPTTILCNI